VEQCFAPSALQLSGEALHILVAMNPSILPEVVTYLSSRLEEPLPPMDAGTIARALLRSARSNGAMIQKVLTFVQNQPDVSVTTDALQELGQIRTRDTQALSFIEASLDSPSNYVRKSAVDSVGRLELSIRANFLTKVTRLATDPKQPEEIRSLANAVLKQ